MRDRHAIDDWLGLVLRNELETSCIETFVRFFLFVFLHLDLSDFEVL